MPNKSNGNRKEKHTKESPWHIMKILRQMDRFGEPLPAFNLKGKDTV